MLLEDMGNAIRTWRQRLGFTQNDLASALQVSPQAVSKWERGENAPDIALLPALSEVLGASVDTLLCSNWRERRTVEATAVFVDMQGFGPLSRDSPPADVAIALNAFFYAVTEHLLARDGIPIKYIGDEILCVFTGEGHRLRAFRAVFAARAAAPKPARYTLASGPVWMGSIGHPLYARPDVLGETVNVASVLQEWLKGNAPSLVAAAASAVDPVRDALELGASGELSTWCTKEPVKAYEVTGLRL